MTTFTQTINETFHVVSCASCGVRFGIEGGLYRRVVTKAEGTIYCPACGCQSHWAESEATKKIRELEQQVQRERQQADQMKASRDFHKECASRSEHKARALKGVVTKKRKQLDRVSKGVCPCCNRSFVDLRRHMEAKHPTFQEPSDG